MEIFASVMGVVFLSEGEFEEEPVVKLPKEIPQQMGSSTTQQPAPTVLLELC